MVPSGRWSAWRIVELLAMDKAGGEANRKFTRFCVSSDTRCWCYRANANGGAYLVIAAEAARRIEVEAGLDEHIGGVSAGSLNEESGSRARHGAAGTLMASRPEEDRVVRKTRIGRPKDPHAALFDAAERYSRQGRGRRRSISLARWHDTRRHFIIIS